MRHLLPFGLLFVFVTACSLRPTAPASSPVPSASSTLLPAPSSSPVSLASPTLLPSATLQVDAPTLESSPTSQALVPNFEHIVILIFENKEYGTIIGNKSLPNFNHYAEKYTLLNAHYATTHPSLPNYLSLIGGDTFGVTSNCNDCYVDAVSLPDLIESSGHTWRTYQERMPSPCYLGDAFKYAQKHNPFIYFTPVRENAERCKNGIVPFTQLEIDLTAKALPNFVFITPDLCNSSHDSGDCPPRIADDWLGTVLPKLQNYLESDGQPYLIILTWDEGQGDHGCCGLPKKAGGRIATILISPQVKSGFQDNTPYTHYSILKTISAAWHLPYLGHAADAENVLILAPWK